MSLCGVYSQTHSQTRKAAGSPPLSRGREGRAGRWRDSLVSSSSPPGVERVRAILGSPLCFSPEWRVQGLWWILPLALSMGLEVLLFTVVLSWGQPETLPGWHMLVGEERTEVLTKTGRQMTTTLASSSPSQSISVNRVADLFHHSIEDVWLVSIDVV